MAFDLKKEYTSLLDKHSSFFEQMRERKFCLLNDFDYCTKRSPTKADDFFNALPPDAIIAICGLGQYTSALYSALCSENRCKINYYTCTDGSHESSMIESREILSLNELKTRHVDYIILASNIFHLEMRKNLLTAGFADEKLLDINVPLKKLADRSINSTACEYSSATHCLNNIPIDCSDISPLYLYYESSYFFSDENKRVEALYTMLLGFIIARDILNIRKYAREYIERKYPMHELLMAYLLDLNGLMEQTRKHIQSRKEDITIVCLFDGYDYSYLEYMPHLERLYQKSLVFSRAFTQYGFTTSTLQIMFTGMDLVDEKAYDVTQFTHENSPLLRTISDNGYVLHVFRSDHRQYLFPKSNCVHTHKVRDKASSHYFEMLDILTSKDEKQILFTHLFETHSPFNSPFNFNKAGTGVFPDSDAATSRQTFGMLCRMLNYMDEQFAFFNDFLPEHSSWIVLSDHGAGRMWIPEYMSVKNYNKIYNDYYFHNTHIALFASGPQINPGTASEFFCLKDFIKLLRFMWGQTGIESLAAQYVKLQILPIYDMWLLNDCNRHQVTLQLPKRGIISSDGVYTYEYNGKEIYYPNEYSNQIDNPVFNEEIEKMRALCGKDFYGLFDSPKFALAKKEYLKRGIIKDD